MQVVLTFTGATASEIIEQMKAFNGAIPAPAAAGPSASKPPKTASAPPAAGTSPAGEIDHETLRAAWSAKKDAGADPKSCVKVLASFGVKKVTELQPAQFADALKAFNDIAVA